MPPRFLTLSIVVFWLGTMGWLFVRDLWPALRPGQRPPFTIDLSREAAGHKSGTHWALYRKGEKIGSANCMTHYHRASDTYVLLTRIHFEKFNHSVVVPIVRKRLDLEFRRMQNIYLVSQEGELRRIDAELDLVCRLDNLDPVPVSIRVSGDVEDGFFTPNWSLKAPGALEPLLNQLTQGWDNEPIDVRAHGSVLNPMHPWNRLLDIREGQRWHMTLFDPLSDSLPGFLGRKGPRVLEAGVLEGTQDLFWGGQDVPCLVIEYRDPRSDTLPARTWVRKSDGLVLRQEAGPINERMVLEREPK